MGGAELLGKRCEGLEVGEVQVLNGDLRLRFGAGNIGACLLALFPISDGQDDVRAFRASTRAVSSPMPLFAPVTTAIRPV